MKKIKAQIHAYQNDVRTAHELLCRLTGCETPLKAWRDGRISRTGKIQDEVEFEFHGIGCFVKTKAFEVDFDYGYNWSVEGFDSWRLQKYVSANQPPRRVYGKTDLIRMDFESLINCGDIKKKFVEYGDKLFFS